MNPFCSLDSADNAMSNLALNACWRGECIACGWEKDRRVRRIDRLREQGLTRATEEEVAAFLAKNEKFLSGRAVAYIRENGLQYFKIIRAEDVG